VVTEPTPSGEHDLERVLELLDHFALPAAVLINKHDLSWEFTARIGALARTAGAEVVGKLPFSPEVPRALAREELPLVVEAVAAPLAEAWERISALLSIGEGKPKRPPGRKTESVPIWTETG
jgi:MinD superfamily P-loop ATPase